MIGLFYWFMLLLLGTGAGFAGAISGLGGGVLIIPALTLLFGMPLEIAAGVSLVSTIATSSGAASAYIRDKLANIKIGMSLEMATTAGAIFGSLIAVTLYAKNLSYIVFIIFGSVLLASAYPQIRKLGKSTYRMNRPDASTNILQLSGTYYDEASGKRIRYNAVRWAYGEIVMLFAGIISGLLGVGSGVLKVIGMDDAMRLPIKVTTATSDFMIGVTAAASGAVYWAFRYIKPEIVAPVVIGVVAGSYAGTKFMERSQSRRIRMIFIIMLAIVGAEMVLRGLGVA